MYKNFNITEEERKQIMEMHQTHGYKKPLNEQYEDESMGDDTNDGSGQDLEAEDIIYIPIRKFTIYVTSKEEDGFDEVPVIVSVDDEGNPVFDVDDVMMPEGGNPEDFINAIKQKMGDHPFKSLNYHGAVLNYKTGETNNY
jgi:hypothetical protein